MVFPPSGFSRWVAKGRTLNFGGLVLKDRCRDCWLLEVFIGGEAEVDGRLFKGSDAARHPSTVVAPICPGERWVWRTGVAPRRNGCPMIRSNALVGFC
jgi:hypothetical protein